MGLAYSPQVTFKIQIPRNQRGNIVIMTGVGPASGTAPVTWKDYAGAFNYAAGLNPRVGRGQSATLEIGLDRADFAGYLAAPGQKLYLMVYSKGGTGTLDKHSIMDYRGAAPRKIASTEAPKAIAPGTANAPALTTLSVAWPGVVSVRERAPEKMPPVAWLKAGSIRVRLTDEAATGAHKVAPALAAGNTIVLKPSELTPFTGAMLCEILIESVLPEGCLSLLHGAGASVGEALVLDPRVDKVTFTGSARAVAEGALVALGGHREGAIYWPTILHGVTPGMRIVREDVFGPVVSVMPCPDFEAVLALADATPYGLQASVFTRDIDRAFRATERLDFGGVILNDTPHLRPDPIP